LGRLVLPADLRHALGIRVGDVLTVDVEDGRLVMAKAQPACVFCGASSELRELAGKQACSRCVDALSGSDAAR
jgi:transcriptional pleiotropic regulator of transition state genes